MCKNRRATFARVAINEDGQVEEYIEGSVKKKTAIWTVVSAVLGILISLFVLRGYVVDGVKEVADHEFDKRLEVFHTVAQPKIMENIADAIQLHQAEAEIVAIERLGKIEQDVAVMQTDITSMKGRSADQTEMLRELLRRTNTGE